MISSGEHTEDDEVVPKDRNTSIRFGTGAKGQAPESFPKKPGNINFTAHVDDDEDDENGDELSIRQQSASMSTRQQRASMSYGSKSFAAVARARPSVLPRSPEGISRAFNPQTTSPEQTRYRQKRANSVQFGREDDDKLARNRREVDSLLKNIGFEHWGVLEHEVLEAWQIALARAISSKRWDDIRGFSGSVGLWLRDPINGYSPQCPLASLEMKNCARPSGNEPCGNCEDGRDLGHSKICCKIRPCTQSESARGLRWVVEPQCTR